MASVISIVVPFFSDVTLCKRNQKETTYSAHMKFVVSIPGTSRETRVSNNLAQRGYDEAHHM